MRRAAAAALVLLALAAAPASAVTQRTTFYAVESQVMCVTCKIPLAEADSAQADQEKQFIRRQVGAGYTAAQIKQQLVGQYGPTVLALPPASGFDLAAYIVPAVVVAALAVAAALLLPRWRRNRAARVAAGDTVAALSADDAARLDADLARFDR